MCNAFPARYSMAIASGDRRRASCSHRAQSAGSVFLRHIFFALVSTAYAANETLLLPREGVGPRVHTYAFRQRRARSNKRA